MYEGKSSWKIPFCYKNYAVNYLKNTDFSHFIIVLCVYNSKSCKNRLKFGGMIIFKKWPRISIPILLGWSFRELERWVTILWTKYAPKTPPKYALIHGKNTLCNCNKINFVSGILL